MGTQNGELFLSGYSLLKSNPALTETGGKTPIGFNGFKSAANQKLRLHRYSASHPFPSTALSYGSALRWSFVQIRTAESDLALLREPQNVSDLWRFSENMKVQSVNLSDKICFIKITLGTVAKGARHEVFEAYVTWEAHRCYGDVCQ